MPRIARCISLALEPGASSPYKLVTGVAMLHAGAFNSAERLFQEVVARRPLPELLATAMAGLGVAAQARGAIDEAKECFLVAINLDPDCWEHHYHLGECHALNGDDLAALTHLMQAVEHDSGPWAARHAVRNPIFLPYLEGSTYGRRLEEAARRSENECEPDTLMPASVFGFKEPVLS